MDGGDHGFQPQLCFQEMSVQVSSLLETLPARGYSEERLEMFVE